MIRVAAFTKYGREAASTRQRLLQYLPRLAAAGIAVDYHPLLGDDYVRSLATGQPFSKRGVAESYLRRMQQLWTGPDCDVIWVYADLFPYLPARFERLAFRAGKPVIYDFDDAFFLAYHQHPNAAARALLAGKLEPLITGAAAVVCGNAYLQDYARRLNPHTSILPTVVDTDLYRPVRGKRERVSIGWIGSPSTWHYVRPVLPIIEHLSQAKGITFRVVGAGHEAKGDGFAGMETTDWSEAGEVADVQAMDVGIMPLPDEPWARGKSGYKLVQYMACGLPVVASPVGVNSSLVDHGATGFLADSDDDWAGALETLIDDAALRTRMGNAARDRAVADYSLDSHAPRLIEIFRRVAGVDPGNPPTPQD